MTLLAEPWRVRIRRRDGLACGAGVLVDRWRILTCAHVVAEALGLEAAGGAPAGLVPVQFTSAPEALAWAGVVSDGWVPPQGGRGDLAVLRLEQPAPRQVTPARLDRCGDELTDRPVRVYGHPEDVDDGVWAQTKLVGIGGPAGEWVQMDGETVTGRRVERGFSGAGAVDDRSGAVIGLVVAEDRDAPNKVAWMIPTELIVGYLPPMRDLLPAPPARPVAPGRAADPGAPAARLPDRRLTPAEQRELCQTLLAVPGMRDRAARDLHIRAVEQQLGHALLFVRQPADFLDLWALVDECLARRGAIRVLLDVLTEMHAGDEAVTALGAVVERMFPDQLLDDDERAELVALAVGLPMSWLFAAHRQATAAVDTPGAGEHPDALALIQDLEAFGRLRGGPPPPLLVFADDLAHRVGGPASVDLHRWIDRVADRLGIGQRPVRTLCTKAAARQTESRRFQFVIQVQPVRVVPDRYLVSAWLQQNQLSERPLLRDDVQRTIDEVVEVLDELLARIPEHAGADIDELTIEFVLPRRLIANPVDQWEFDRQRFPRPLGIQYPVVVRSLERLGNQSLHPDWRRKWRWLAENGHRPDGSAVHWIDRPGMRDLRALYSELSLEERPVCLAMAFPPGAAETLGGDELEAGLSAGIPVVVWLREPAEPARFRELLDELMAERGILGLPQKLLWLRRSATGTIDRMQREPHLGLRLGMLWDDADRLPAPFRRPVRLRAPE